MKVILNVDVKSLGEEGDVKNVATGYARNFLLPRNLAVPYNEATVMIFEARKAEIEARKEQKRKDSASLKEKLEAAGIRCSKLSSIDSGVVPVPSPIFGTIRKRCVSTGIVGI